VCYVIVQLTHYHLCPPRTVQDEDLMTRAFKAYQRSANTQFLPVTILCRHRSKWASKHQCSNTGRGRHVSARSNCKIVTRMIRVFEEILRYMKAAVMTTFTPRARLRSYCGIPWSNQALYGFAGSFSGAGRDDIACPCPSRP
jgi:hypothetical protein